MSLEGKNILITGAARRVGRSLALALARAGADIFVHYGASADEAVSLKAEIESLGRRAYLLQADLNDPRQVMDLVPRALENAALFGLVNNASLFEPLSWQETHLNEWNRHLMVNLTTPFLLSQAFAESLQPDQSGRIVNLLDWRALRPGPDHLPYTISKAGLAALTRSLAIALAPAVTVNGMALGAILPPSDGGAADGLLRQVPVGRWAELDEVSQTLLFFMDGPTYVTGEIIHLDGGRHLV